MGSQGRCQRIELPSCSFGRNLAGNCSVGTGEALPLYDFPHIGASRNEPQAYRCYRFRDYFQQSSLPRQQSYRQRTDTHQKMEREIRGDDPYSGALRRRKQRRLGFRRG